jgi:hypothetical protein
MIGYEIIGNTGTTGATGNGIASVIRTSGTGAPGTTDTYTITYTNATTSTFNVVNGTVGSSNTTQSILLSAVADLSLGNIINVTVPIAVDTTIPEPINPVVGLVGWNWQQDATGNRTITLPNGTTITGGLPNEFQSALFLYNGVNYIKLANG